MKIKVTRKNYESVMNIPKEKHKLPKKNGWFFRNVIKLVSIPDIKKHHFKCEKLGMEKLGKKEPALFLMNHSCFIDLEIVGTLLAKRPYNIVTTTDAFVGKNWLMRAIGCIPTKKFVNDTGLVKDMQHVLTKLKSSVVMFPEASYSFDGTATPLPTSLGMCIKYLGVPVVMIRTYGAFQRDPLYNNIQVRKIDVSAKEEYILSPEQISEMTTEEINSVLNSYFNFDNFKWQQENKIKVDEPFRADYLNRVLYKCPECMKEGEMHGEGEFITCRACGKTHRLTEYGFLEATDGEPNFTHIPDWYKWERKCVKDEILNGTYSFDIPVDILMTVNTKHLYSVGEGRLTHSKKGFHLVGCGGKIDYTHKALTSYSLYADYNWYEIGDMICIGNHDALYYCFPKEKCDIVAKARIATEEIFKIVRAEKRGGSSEV